MKLKKSNSDTRYSMSSARIASLAGVVFLSLAAFLGSACQPNSTILKDVAPAPTPMATAEVKKTSVEQDLAEMKIASFNFIYVFRRKDGAVFDNEDRKFLRQNTPPETNKFLSSDDGRAFIAGSVFTFLPEQLTALGKRFVVEDHSKPEAKELAKQQINANKANTNTSNTNSVKKEK